MNITTVSFLKLFVLYCSTSFNSDELTGAIKMEEGDDLKLIALPCSGKVDLLYLVKAFEKGADGVVLLTCPKNKCKNFEGNLRALKRADGVNAILEETGLGRDRMTVVSLAEGGIEGVASEITKFSRRLRNVSHAAEAAAVSF